MGFDKPADVAVAGGSGCGLACGAMEAATATLEEQLRGVVAAALEDGSATVRDLHRLTGGASRETWAFEAVTRSEVRRLILRRDPPALARAHGISAEAIAIQAAARRGVPEPVVLVYDDDPAVLGAPFMIMELVEGETLARRILRDDAFAAVRPRLAAECGDILARIHSIPVGEVPMLSAHDQLERMRSNLAGYEEPSPVFELALRWLDENRPAPVAPAVVHGDFRNGNLIVGPDGVRAVLDWELCHLGDPMEDLGWLCVRAWRFGSDAPVGGFGGRAELFAAYAERAGRPVDPDTVLWWEVLGTLRWGIGCMEMSSGHLSGELRSVELAAIGRRTWEQEYDVMLLLEPLLGGA